MKNLALIALCSILLTSCAVGRKVKYNDLILDLYDVKTKNIDLALLDHREAVVNGSRTADFVGYMRSGAGIAYTIKTVSKNDFIVDLSNNIINSLHRYDITVENVPTKWQNGEQEVKSELFKLKGDKKIFLVFDELHTDGYMIQFLYYKINLFIYDKNNTLLHSKAINGKKKLGGNVAFGAGPFKTYMPEAMKNLFQDIFKDKEVLDALNK